MPANKKYLMTSRWARFSKVLASILGAYLASISFHLTLALFFDRVVVLGTSIVTTFILWGGFMLLIYKIQKPWKAWLVLGGVIVSGAVSFMLLR